MYIKIQVFDTDLRAMLAKTLTASRKLRDFHRNDESWCKTFISGMVKGKVIAFEMMQAERGHGVSHGQELDG